MDIQHTCYKYKVGFQIQAGQEPEMPRQPCRHSHHLHFFVLAVAHADGTLAFWARGEAWAEEKNKTFFLGVDVGSRALA